MTPSFFKPRPSNLNQGHSKSVSESTQIRFRRIFVAVIFGVLFQSDNGCHGIKLRECGDPSWFSSPGNDLCYKNLGREMTKPDAVAACSQETQFLYEDPLLTVTSDSEQNFVNFEIFGNRGIKKNLWLGGYRKGPNNWKWDDNAPFDFTKWKDESHKHATTPKCLRMLAEDQDPQDVLNFNSAGVWEAVPCTTKNLVICQKPKATEPQKNSADLQKKLSKARKDLDKTTADLQKLQTEYQQTKIQADQTKEDLLKLLGNFGLLYNESQQTGVTLLGTIKQVSAAQLATKNVIDNDLPLLNAGILMKLNETSMGLQKQINEIKSKLLKIAGNVSETSKHSAKPGNHSKTVKHGQNSDEADSDEVKNEDQTSTKKLDAIKSQIENLAKDLKNKADLSVIKQLNDSDSILLLKLNETSANLQKQIGELKSKLLKTEKNVSETSKSSAKPGNHSNNAKHRQNSDEADSDEVQKEDRTSTKHLDAINSQIENIAKDLKNKADLSFIKQLNGSDNTLLVKLNETSVNLQKQVDEIKSKLLKTEGKVSEASKHSVKPGNHSNAAKPGQASEEADSDEVQKEDRASAKHLDTIKSQIESLAKNLKNKADLNIIKQLNDSDSIILLKLNETSTNLQKQVHEVNSSLQKTESLLFDLTSVVLKQANVSDTLLKNLSQIYSDTAKLKQNLGNLNTTVDRSTTQQKIDKINATDQQDIAKSSNNKIETLVAQLSDQVTKLQKDSSENLKIYQIKLDEVKAEAQDFRKPINETKVSKGAVTKNLDVVQSQSENPKSSTNLDLIKQISDLNSSLLLNLSQVYKDTAAIKQRVGDLYSAVEVSKVDVQQKMNTVQENVTNLQDNAKSLNKKLEILVTDLKEQIATIQSSSFSNLKNYQTKLEEVTTESTSIKKSVKEAKDDLQAFKKDLDALKDQTEDHAKDLKNKANLEALKQIEDLNNGRQLKSNGRSFGYPKPSDDNNQLKLEELESLIHGAKKSIREIKDDNRAMAKSLDSVKEQTENLARNIRTKADANIVEEAIKNLKDDQGRLAKDLNHVLKDSNEIVEGTVKQMSDVKVAIRNLQDQAKQNINNNPLLKFDEATTGFHREINEINTRLLNTESQVLDINSAVARQNEVSEFLLKNLSLVYTFTAANTQNLEGLNTAVQKLVLDSQQNRDTVQPSASITSVPDTAGSSNIQTQALIADLRSQITKITDEQGRVSKDLTDLKSLSTKTIDNLANPQRKVPEEKGVSAAIPIGFVYIHYPFQQHPEDIWPNTTWKDVSGRYSGMFFRVAGGNANGFGQVQPDSTRQTSRIEFSSQKGGRHYPILAVPKTGMSNWVSIGRYHQGNNEFSEYLRFETTNTEVRPLNMAVVVYVRIR